MLKKKEDRRVLTKPSPFNGRGEITVDDILEGPDEMYNKGRVFCHTSIAPGAGIGYHIHENESETYYILNGHGTFCDDGKEIDVSPGDVLFTGDGQGHGLKASKGEAIDLIALILYH